MVLVQKVFMRHFGELTGVFLLFGYWFNCGCRLIKRTIL